MVQSTQQCVGFKGEPGPTSISYGRIRWPIFTIQEHTNQVYRLLLGDITILFRALCLSYVFVRARAARRTVTAYGRIVRV